MSYLRPALLTILSCALLALAACGDEPDPADNDDPAQNDNGTNQNDDPNQDNDDPNQDNDDPNQDNADNNGECPSDPCTEGDTRCSGDGVETCVSVSGCPTWSDVSDCEGDKVCSGGECVDECDDVCDDGATECDGDGVRTCEEQSSGCLDWSSTESCEAEETCEDGVCQACDDGAQRCADDGQAIEECFDGQWDAVQSCPVDCQDAECLDEIECSPGDYQCNGDVVEVCNSTGTAYLYVATCTAQCEDGQCTGDCEPGAQRCNGDDVEICNDDGTAWELEETCDDTTCDSTINDCALEEWEITSDVEMDGTVVVDGPVTVYSGADLYSPEGDLKIIATSITVEDGASITMARRGDNPEGAGVSGEINCNCGFQCTMNSGGTGGSYGTQGEGNDCDDSPGAFARNDDIDVVQGSPGGEASEGGAGGYGGGVLHLAADVIDVQGSLRADGEDGDDYSTATWCGSQRHSGGGSGGGILLAADDLSFSGTADVEGGQGSDDDCNNEYGGDGGHGIVKFLYGAEYDNSGTVHGVSYEGLKAPIDIFSSTHPDPTLYYNDDFDTIALSWERPFDSVDGYYQALNATQFFVPYAGNASFTPDEVLTHPREIVDDGQNYFHITPVDAQANVGEMESRFPINVNTLPPSVSSSSHSDSTQWSDNTDVFLEWTDERDEANFVGYYYTVDQLGDTVPTTDDTYVPVDQKQTLLANEPDGIWAFHIAPVDTMGYLTKEAETYVYRIGDDPGTGNILGTVRDEDQDGIEGAAVTINRGLLHPHVADESSGSNGSYNFGGDVPAGEWELRVSADGYETKYVDVTLSQGQDNTVDVTLTEE